MPSERQEIWQLREDNNELRRQLDAANTENKRLTTERDEAIRGRFDDQETARSLGNQLSARQGEVEDLRSLLQTEREKMIRLTEGTDSAIGEALRAQEELSRLNQQLIEVRAEDEAKGRLILEQSRLRQAMQAKIVGLEDVRVDRNNLAIQNRHLVSQNHRLKSQVGNFLVGSGRVGISYYALQFLGGLPLIGSLFRETSGQVYEDHTNIQNVQGPKKDKR